MSGAVQNVDYIRIENGTLHQESSKVICEAPVSLTVNGVSWITFMCTPIDLEDLAVGFLFNESQIQSYEDIADLRVCPSKDNVDVWTNFALEKPEFWRRTSGCAGGYSHASSAHDEEHNNRLNKLTNGGVITSAQINRLIEDLFEAQTLYKQSGGVHTSIMTDGENLTISAEDIGRHNTLDKLAGRVLREKLAFSHRILLTTGRISSEMLQKAARLNSSFLITRTSPTSLSIELADAAGITLIGYARRNQFNIYTHPERVIPVSKEPKTHSSIKSNTVKQNETK